MQNLPKPKLNGISALTITTHDLEVSLEFYKKLGFYEVFRADFPFPWVHLTDGVLLIMLRKEPVIYISLTYYVNEIDKLATDLEMDGVKFFYKPKSNDVIKRYITHSPDGLNVSLVTLVEGFKKPEGQMMFMMPQEDFFNPDKYVNKVCGLFGELAHPVKDISQSLPFWEKLGFVVLSKFEAPYPWAIISDGLFIIGLHQTTNFDYPAITYFASDMEAKIAHLKLAGIEGVSEGDTSKNMAIVTPEKQHINLFKLGM